MLRLAFVCGLALPLAANAADDAKDVPKDLLPFQGAWKLVKVEVGFVAPKDAVKEEVRFTFAGSKLTIREGKAPPHEGTYSVSPKADPAEIDLVNAGKQKSLGIYKFDADGRLIISFVRKPDAPRPKKFGETDAVVLFLEKAKPEAKKEVAKEMVPFQGVWKVVKVEAGGKELPAGQPQGMRFFFNGNSLEITEGKNSPKEGGYSINPKAEPEEIDLLTPERQKIVGIYKFDQAGKLTITLSTNPKAKRPTKFDEAETLTFVMEKVKE